MNRAPALERILPNSQDAEMSVLGSALLAFNDCWPEIRSRLTADTFYFAAHQTLFRALERMTGAVDAVTVCSELRNHGELENIGGSVFLTDLVSHVPTTANLSHYIAEVVDKWQRRQLVEIGFQLQAKAFDASLPATDASGEAVKLITNLYAREQETRHVGQIVPEVMAELETQRNNPSETAGLTTGYYILDKVTSGFKPGEYWIIAGKPGTGKTALAVEMAMRCAERSRQGVGIFSLEMKDRALIKRALASRAGVNMRRLHDTTPERWQGLTKAAAAVQKLPVYVNENARLTPSRIRGEIMLWVRRFDVKVVVLDYIQIVKPSRSGMDLREHINEVSSELMACAKEYGITVIALSQLRKLIAGKRPTNDDLKETSSIEQDAHVIMLLSRGVTNEDLPAKWSGVFEQSKLEEFTYVDITKQREGDTLPVFLRFEKEYTRFTDITTHSENES